MVDNGSGKDRWVVLNCDGGSIILEACGYLILGSCSLIDTRWLPGIYLTSRLSHNAIQCRVHFYATID